MGRSTVLLVAVAVSAVACGGGGRPARADYDRTLGHICGRANVRLAAIELPELTAPGAAARVGELVRVGRRALDELRAVDAPRRDGSGREVWLAALEQALDEGAYVEQLLRSGATERAVDAAARADALAARVRHLGADLGIRDTCRIPPLADLG